MTKITYKKWLKTYKPIVQEGESRNYDGLMLETYGSDMDKVRAAWKESPNTIWTLLDEDGYTWIGAGFHYVNRLGYFICEVPFANENLEVPQ